MACSYWKTGLGPKAKACDRSRPPLGTLPLALVRMNPRFLAAFSQSFFLDLLIASKLACIRKQPGRGLASPAFVLCGGAAGSRIGNECCESSMAVEWRRKYIDSCNRGRWGTEGAGERGRVSSAIARALPTRTLVAPHFRSLCLSHRNIRGRSWR